jgi:hypothetical protein
MKTSYPPANSSVLKRLSAVLLLAAFGATCTVADVVYVTGEQQGTTVAGIQTDGTYAEIGQDMSGNFGSKGTADGRPLTAGVVRLYYGNAYPTDGTAGCDIIPTLANAGATYLIDYNFSSTAGNTTTNAVFAATCTGGTLDFTSTDKLQRKYGNPANQWQRMGKVTLNADVTQPAISFRYQSGFISGTSQNRLIFDCWRFTYEEPCTKVGVVTVTGPLAANLPNVTVTGVSTNATALTLYQNAGTGFTNIGSLAVSSAGATVVVPVTGQLVKGAQVGATQTISGQEGCTPTVGTLVGGGANPNLRVTLGIRETASTGPVGAFGGNGANIYFYPCSSVLSGTCPGNDTISITPGAGWQTVTVPGRQTIGDSANAAGTVQEPSGATSYAADQTPFIQVYAYKTVNTVQIFSRTPAQSASVTSNNVFVVNWTWDAVSSAEGYRLLRSLDGTTYDMSSDVVAGTSFLDDSITGWVGASPVTPTAGQTMPSIMWNPTVTVTNIGTQWGALDGIMLISDDATDCGPYNIYVDNLANGSTVFQDFEGFAAGTVAGAVYNQPSYSGQTAGNILDYPNDATIVNEAAYAGVRSQRVQWQYKETALVPRWIRFNHYQATAMPNPLVNLDDDVSFKILVLPVGANPVPPLDSVRITNITATAIQYTGGTYSGFGGVKFVLLESANVNALLSTWTRAQTNTATPGSFTIPPSGTQKFYSIKSEYQP